MNKFIETRSGTLAILSKILDELWNAGISLSDFETPVIDIEISICLCFYSIELGSDFYKRLIGQTCSLMSGFDLNVCQRIFPFRFISTGRDLSNERVPMDYHNSKDIRQDRDYTIRYPSSLCNHIVVFAPLPSSKKHGEVWDGVR